MAAFDYSGLSPDTVLDAIESQDVIVDSGLLALNSYENRVYQFKDRDEQSWVVKFYRPNRWSKEQILEEHEFALELEQQEIPVVAPHLIDGESLHEFQGFQWTLFPCRGGRIFEVDNLDQLEWMGRFVGRMHAVAQTHDFKHRPAINTDEYLLQARDTLVQSELVTSALATPFFTILEHVIDATLQQYQPDQHMRLHGDCHAGNIFWTDAGPHFVDLDDCRAGPAVQDLWMMLSGDRQQQTLQMDTLLLGYEEFCDFDHKQLALIEPLRAMRMVNYMAWLAKRWQDPAFPRNFPWFATDKYWEQQILALKEQLAALAERPISLMPGQ